MEVFYILFVFTAISEFDIWYYHDYLYAVFFILWPKSNLPSNEQLRQRYVQVIDRVS